MIRILMLVLTAVCAAPAFAGGLTPPGAPAPTMKTLDEVEPRIPVGPLTTPGDSVSVYRITQPGSYYLTGDVLGEVNKSGVTILAGDVTLDLGGFSLIGVLGSNAGVNTGGGVDRVTIMNGVVRDWGLWGINLSSGTRASVRNCSATGNAQFGIQVGAESEVVSCLASANGGSGVVTGDASLVRDVRASANGGNGIQTGLYCLVRDAVANDNSARGVTVGTGSVVTACVAKANADDGVATGTGSMISDCTASFNGDDGFVIGSSSSITNCVAFANTGDGILGSTDNRIVGNTVDSAGNGGDGAGIRVTSSDNVVTDNFVTDSDRGIDVDAFGNFIARNWASGNTVNYDIVTGNVCFVLTAATSGAISGSSGGVSPGSTDPNANYSF